MYSIILYLFTNDRPKKISFYLIAGSSGLLAQRKKRNPEYGVLELGLLLVLL